jgi:thiol-disulfide isomerase/thioredoxin
MPALEAIQKEYGERLQVLAVSYRDIDDDTRDFVAKLGVTYPTLITEVADTSVAKAYGVHGIPVTFFIGADGRVATEPLYGEGSRKALQPGVDELVG